MLKSHTILVAAILAIPVLTIAQSSSLAATFKLRGGAGAFPPKETVESFDGTAINLDILNTLPTPATGSRSATASGFMDNGIVQLSAETMVTTGTPSIGTLEATMSGEWSDTLTFFSPGTIGGFTIVNGTTAGTADLIVNLSGNLERTAGGNEGDPQTGYSASLNFNNCSTGSCR